VTEISDQNIEHNDGSSSIKTWSPIIITKCFNFNISIIIGKKIPYDGEPLKCHKTLRTTCLCSLVGNYKN